MEQVRLWTAVRLAALALAAVGPSTPRRRPPLSYDVVEESPPGTVVSDRLLDDAGLAARYPADVLASLRFTVLPAGGQVDERRRDYLSVEPRTGRLRLSAAIDRDVICRRRVTCSLTFGVAVHPAQ